MNIRLSLQDCHDRIQGPTSFSSRLAWDRAEAGRAPRKSQSLPYTVAKKGMDERAGAAGASEDRAPRWSALRLCNLVAQSARDAEGGLQACSGEGVDGKGRGAGGVDLFQGLQNPDSRYRAGDRDGSSDAGHGQFARLLPGDDLRRLSGWRALGQWQPGDPAQLDLTLLQVLARRTAAGFPRKPAREGILRIIRPKAAPSRLDPLSYESLRQQILRRDGWRCQSCGTMSNLEVHHREF